MESCIIGTVLIFITIFSCSYSMPDPSGCFFKHIDEPCGIEINCYKVINTDFYDYINIYRLDTGCPVTVSVPGYSSERDPVYLKIKDFSFVNFDDYGSELNFPTGMSEWSIYLIYSLDLSGNEISSVPTFTTMSNLNILNLSNNDLMEAKLSNKYDLDSLTEVDYSHNTISGIAISNNETQYRRLKKLNLSHNYLVSIQEAIFDSLTELENLDLSHNFIDSLSILTFEGTRNLLVLNLKDNRLSELNSALLRFGKLIELNLSENKLENVKFEDFGKLTSLKDLDVSSNLIVHIDKNVFSHTLGTLDLSSNFLEVIEKEVFTNLSNLVKVNLSNNNFKSLPKDMFKDKHLSKFSIKENQLEGSLIKGTFEGLSLVIELDLSNQRLSSIEDFAFYGLRNLKTLLVNNNRLEILSRTSFSTLRSLEVLDLSNNQLSNIDFDKYDLISLRSFLLDNNNIIQIKHESLIGLNMLQFLDLSNNNISQLNTNSFKSLRDLINFQISNNPISGTLEENTFDGLNSLPSLDISSTLLTVIKNSSFHGMSQLKHLNISHSKISELQYNAFDFTGQIETLDLSFNELREFIVNTTELTNVQSLFLNNNLLVTISSSCFTGLLRLIKIVISHNNIQTFNDQAFEDQMELQYLDLSYNSHLKFNISQLERNQNLASLLLSAIQTNITFKFVKEIKVTYLEMSHSEICNITVLELNQLSNINELILSFNNISRVEVVAFKGVKSVRKLDLSFNKIAYIQPGAFKDNVMLNVLNISHNCLTSLGYGIFRGLINLGAIDISYNEINNLQSERFYEVRSLNILIADHNRIDTVNADEFAGTSLSILSIGDNPIACRELVNLKKGRISFAITAVRLDESSDENVDGVTCNIEHTKKIEQKSGNIFQNENVLIDIRDILQNFTSSKYRESTKMLHSENVLHEIKDILQNYTFGKYKEYSNAELPDNTKYLSNFSSIIEKLNSNLNLSVSNTKSFIGNISAIFAKGNMNTNMLLDKIFKFMSSKNAIERSNSTPVLKENATSEGLIIYINKIKQELEDAIGIEKQNILSEIDNKISSLNNQKVSPSALTNEAYSGKQDIDSKSFLFMEICVALILVILVVFILYKFYNSGVFVLNRHSISTRHLSDTIENSAL